MDPSFNGEPDVPFVLRIPSPSYSVQPISILTSWLSHIQMLLVVLSNTPLLFGTFELQTEGNFIIQVLSETAAIILLSRAQRVQNLAYALKMAGIQPGDRVAVISPNWYVRGLLWLGGC